MKELKESRMFGNDNLKLCFQENKAGLFWKGQELTKGISLHTAFCACGKWHDSTSADWRIKEISRDKLCVSVKYRDIAVTQNWILKLVGANELSWDVETLVTQPLKIQHRKIGLFLSDTYTRWFNASEQGEFSQEFNWNDIRLARLDSRGFGVKPEAGNPGVLFEVFAEGIPLLQNSNKEFRARALQFELADIIDSNEHKTVCSTRVRGRIKLIEDEVWINAYIEESRKKFIAANSLINDTVKVFFEKRLARLYWRDIELTKHFGIHTIFSVKDIWYGSSYADWQVTRIGRDKVQIIIDYKDIPVIHKWTLSFTGHNELSWDVEIQVKEPVHISHEKMGLFVADKYDQWFSSSEEGVFPAGFNWENIFLKHTDSKGFGVKPVQAIPGILFEVEAEGAPLLQNTNEQFSARALQFELEPGVAGSVYEVGSYKRGLGRIKIIENERVIGEYINNQKKIQAAAKSFSKDKLRLCFDEGSAKLYWNEQELTKGIGLHIALNVNGNWYDSLHAEWQFKKFSREKIYINVRYRDIPVELKWTLSLTGAEELVWDVHIQVKETLQIPHKKISLFLSDKYTHWFNSSEEGEFPRGFNWERIFLNQIDSRGFGVKPVGDYPGILFEANVEGAPLIQNTNEQLKGRAVQFELSAGKDSLQYLPGNTYKLFSGKIRLIEDEKIINDYMASRQLLPLEPLDNQTLCIFGDSEELHNKIAASPADFKEKLQRIKQGGDKNKQLNIKIGVSRYNFFKIKETVKYAVSLLGKNTDLGPLGLDLFPVQKLYYNFVNYIEEIKAKIKDTEVKLVLADKELLEILLTVASQANPYNEKKLLRLLSVITEHTFLGPQIVVIDPYHRCNVNCLHCWVHTPKIKHTDEFLNRKLDFDTYKLMIDDFAELKVDSIIFQGDGEPLLHDKFLEMVRYARGKGIEVLFFTNGLLLNHSIAQESVALGVSQIFCSLPAGTDKTYCLVTHRQDSTAFRKVLDNLKYLTSVKRQANKIYPKLIMTHVIHTLNYQEIMQMAQNDIEVGADVMRFYLIRLDDNIKFLQLKLEEIECIRESMSKVKAYLKDKHVELLDTTDFQLDHYEKDTGAWSKGVFLKEGCPLGWFFSLVPALGDLSLCCHLRTVGYLKEKSFKEIWTSQEYEKYRVQAKYLKDNQNVTFLNGVKLYDEHCEHCDTHQVIRDIWEEMKNYNLERFVFK